MTMRIKNSTVYTRGQKLAKCCTLFNGVVCDSQKKETKIYTLSPEPLGRHQQLARSGATKATAYPSSLWTNRTPGKI
jgi:hypothetical protein